MNFESFKRKYQKVEVNHYPNRVTECPKVSVLVQTFNHEFFIRECLKGILIQETDFEFEILLGEDQSSDNTREICIEYAKKYPKKIRLFLHHPENKIKVLGTTTGNFNAFYNLFSAKGELIAFCEGDDVWSDPLKLQKQVDLLQAKPNLACTYHSFLEVNEQLEPLPIEKTLMQPRQNISNEDLKKLNFHPLLSTLCFRNHFKIQIPEEMVEVLNVDSFILSFLGNYGSAEFERRIRTTLYRRHSMGVWSMKKNLTKSRSKILTYKKLKEYYFKKEDRIMVKHFSKLSRKNRKILVWNYLMGCRLKSHG